MTWSCSEALRAKSVVRCEIAATRSDSALGGWEERRFERTSASFVGNLLEGSAFRVLGSGLRVEC